MDDVTLADVWRAASELEQGELHDRSVLYATWASIFSIQASLESNANKYQALLGCLRSDGGLPDERTTRRELAGYGMLYDTQVNALYWAEYLHQSGKLRGLEMIGATRGEQENWRDVVFNLWHDASGAHGMWYKTISMAALLLHPTTCELVPVDRHVLAYTGTKQARSLRRYVEIEAQVDQMTADIEANLAVKHWLRWEQQRQATHERKRGTGCESHLRLSCRIRKV